MITKIANWVKTKLYNRQKSADLQAVKSKYGINPYLTQKLINLIEHQKLTINNCIINYIDAQKYVCVVFNIGDIEIMVELNDEQDIFGDKIYIVNPTVFCSSIKSIQFGGEDVCTVSSKLSRLNISDTVASAMANVLVFWSATFDNFYCYTDDNYAIMGWTLYDQEFLEVVCKKSNHEDVTMYMTPVNLLDTLTYITECTSQTYKKIGE